MAHQKSMFAFCSLLDKIGRLENDYVFCLDEVVDAPPQASFITLQHCCFDRCGKILQFRSCSFLHVDKS
jgi:hypothetical protein